MNAFDEQSRSLWMDTTIVTDEPPLNANRRADTVIVGSGIAGFSTAYGLARRGEKVIVLDRGRIAGRMTSRTSAHLTSQIGRWLQDHHKGPEPGGRQTPAKTEPKTKRSERL